MSLGGLLGHGEHTDEETMKNVGECKEGGRRVRQRKKYIEDLEESLRAERDVSWCVRSREE